MIACGYVLRKSRVAVAPGATAFTVTPRAPRSCASTRMSWLTAPFDPVYSRVFQLTVESLVKFEDMKMTRPPGVQ